MAHVSQGFICISDNQTTSKGFASWPARITTYKVIGVKASFLSLGEGLLADDAVANVQTLLKSQYLYVLIFMENSLSRCCRDFFMVPPERKVKQSYWCLAWLLWKYNFAGSCLLPLLQLLALRLRHCVCNFNFQ